MLTTARPIASNPGTTWASNTNLIIFAFSLVFYARIITTMTPVPSIVSHAHFVIVPLVTAIALLTTPTKNEQQLRLVKTLLTGLFIFFMVNLASALWNGAGMINAIASFMMLGEPVMFITAIICIPMSGQSISKVQTWFVASAIINFLLAAVQKPLIDMGKLYAYGFDGTDGCGGVFFVSGAGNYVSAGVSTVAALYFLRNGKNCPLWIRAAAMTAAGWQLVFSDAKQLVLAYAVGWVLLIVFNVKDIEKTIKLLIAMTVTGLTFLWCVNNLPFFAAFSAWSRPELYAKDGAAWFTKFYSIRAILGEFSSVGNWLFGLGPGHSVTRLGAWFMQDYSSILEPLGATTSSLGAESREFITTFWLAKGSSLFSPIFSWVGIWGDIGLVGLSAYLYLAYLVWSNLAIDNSLKITMLSMVVIGCVFTQLEEPGYMLSFALLLSLAWQKKRLKLEQNRQATQV